MAEIHKMTEQQKQLLESLEEEFKSRYTEEDEDYKRIGEIELTPPTVERWEGGNDHNDRNHRNDRYNHRNDRRRDYHYYDRRDRRNSPYERGYRDDSYERNYHSNYRHRPY